jgi:hypothetical protein
LDLSGAPAIDFTSAIALNDMICNTPVSTGRKAMLAGMRPKLKSILNKQNIFKTFDEEFIHTERVSALSHAAT